METKASYSNKIDEAYLALCNHIVSGARGRPPAWPLSIRETLYYYSQFLPKDVLCIIRGLEERGLSKEEIARMFYGPSGINHWLYVAGWEFKGLNRKERIEFIERTIDLVAFHRKGDVFCRDGKNRLWDSNEVQKAVNKAGFVDTRNNHALSKTIGKINTVIWHYCILIQAGFRNYSHEFHGPYDIGNDELLFVREYFNLNPKEIWPFAQNVTYDRITIFEVLRKMEVKVDMFNHIYTSTSFASNLQRFLIQIDDGKILTREEVENLLTSWIDIINEANAFIRDYKKPDWIKKAIEMQYLFLKPHKEILGMNWRAPKDILDLASKFEDTERLNRKAIQKFMEIIKTSSEEQAKQKIAQMFSDNIYEGKIRFYE